MEKINTRALNLERLKEEKNKITLGFKCAPQLKLQLAQAAQKLNITLSEYVESIVVNHNQETVNPLENVVNPLKEKLAFYENDTLKALFTEHKGKTYEFTGASGKSIKVTVNGLQDVYTILINSFKISK